MSDECCTKTCLNPFLSLHNFFTIFIVLLHIVSTVLQYMNTVYKNVDPACITDCGYQIVVSSPFVQIIIIIIKVLLYVLGTRRKESLELSPRSRNVKKFCSSFFRVPCQKALGLWGLPYQKFNNLIINAVLLYVSPREVTWNVYWEFPLPNFGSFLHAVDRHPANPYAFSLRVPQRREPHLRVEIWSQNTRSRRLYPRHLLST